MGRIVKSILAVMGALFLMMIVAAAFLAALGVARPAPAIAQMNLGLSLGIHAKGKKGNKEVEEPPAVPAPASKEREACERECKDKK